MRICSHCNLEKDENEFLVHQVNGLSYYHAWCESCEIEVAKERRIAQKQRRKKYDNEGRCIYSIIHDPDNTWGKRSQFTLREFRYLLQYNFMTPGTLIKHIPSNTVYIVLAGGKLSILEK